jgi:hypothetical protein
VVVVFGVVVVIFMVEVLISGVVVGIFMVEVLISGVVVVIFMVGVLISGAVLVISIVGLLISGIGSGQQYLGAFLSSSKPHLVNFLNSSNCLFSTNFMWGLQSKTDLQSHTD